MKFITRFFLLVLMAPCTLYAASPLSGTSGSNLTSFNGSMGSLNNNNWNSLANPGKPLPTADFGNCNSLILRCAQPKCASGGCVSMDIAVPIVSGCVNSNETCKSHGDDLIQSIAAQLVASSTAKANAAAAEASANSNTNDTSNQQSAEQLAAMQQQMQQLQTQLTTQSEQTNAAIQSALAAQAAAQPVATTAPTNSAPVSDTATIAAQNGVSADVLARQQASGDILTQIENAEDSLKALKKTMQDTFDYAGCDSNGNNCKGPKRIAVFKEKADNFFDPYNNVLDETYDALIMAQSLGVDIADIYMMLNDSCNVWGKYLCTEGQQMRYTAEKNDSIGSCYERSSGAGLTSNSGAKCTVGQIIPINDGGCQLLQMLTSRDAIQDAWLNPDITYKDPDDKKLGVFSEVRVGCASEAIDNSMLFKSRKKQASIDIDTLQRIIEQDSPTYLGTGEKVEKDMIKYCSIGTEGRKDLEKITKLKKLPTDVCMKNIDKVSRLMGTSDYSTTGSDIKTVEDMKNMSNEELDKNAKELKCSNAGGEWDGSRCSCSGLAYDTKKFNNCNKVALDIASGNRVSNINLLGL